MKINFINHNNHYFVNRNITFKSSVDDLEKLSKIEELLKQQYEIEIKQKESYLADTYMDIDTAKQSIRILEERLNSQNNEINQLSSINKSARSTLSSLIPSIQLLAEQKNEYEDKIRQLTKYKKELQAKADAIIQQKQQESLSIITEHASKINHSIQKVSPQLQSIHFPKPNGFGAIAGFNTVKAHINSCIGEPLVLEQTGKLCDVPSGILFYGPDAINNLNIAKSVANQYGCNCVIIPSDIENPNKMEFLEKVVANARNRFTIDNKRTMVIIDNFDDFTLQTKRDRDVFKAFLDNVSSMYKATILAISQNPEKLDPIILRDGRFNKIAIANANFKDIIEIVKRYVPLDLLDRLNIIDFAKQIFKLQGENAFSVKQIKELTMLFADKFSEIHNIKPEISKEKIMHFKKQLKLLKSI